MVAANATARPAAANQPNQPCHCSRERLCRYSTSRRFASGVSVESVIMVGPLNGHRNTVVDQHATVQRGQVFLMHHALPVLLCLLFRLISTSPSLAVLSLQARDNRVFRLYLPTSPIGHHLSDGGNHSGETATEDRPQNQLKVHEESPRSNSCGTRWTARSSTWRRTSSRQKAMVK